MSIASNIHALAVNNSQPHTIVANACKEYETYKLNIHVMDETGIMGLGIKLYEYAAKASNGMLIVFPDNSVLIDECWNGTYKPVNNISELTVYNGGKYNLLSFEDYKEFFGWRLSNPVR